MQEIVNKETKEAFNQLLAKARDVILTPQSQDLSQMIKLVTQYFEYNTLCALLKECPLLKTLHVFHFVSQRIIVQELSSFTGLDQLKIFLTKDVLHRGIEQILKLKNLKSLGLNNSELNDETFRVIAENLPNLRNLIVKSGTYTRKGILALKKLPSLRSLGFDTVQMRDDLVDAIREILPDLEEVILHTCTISKQKMMFLMTNLNKLKSVKLWRCKLTPEDFAIILNRFPELTDLDLSQNNGLNEQHMRLIGRMKNLRFLELYKCDIKPQYFEVLAKEVTFNLDHFYYDNSKIDKGFDSFIIKQTNLKILSLPQCNITDHNLLTISKYLNKLEYIVLSSNKITSKGYMYLFRMKLRRIHLRMMTIPPEMVLRHFMNSSIFEFIKPASLTYKSKNKRFYENQKEFGLRRILD